MEITDYIAIYAAVLSTLVFICQIYAWLWSTRLKLNARVATNMMMVDSINPTGDGKRYIILNIENRGAVSCTVTHVVVAHYATTIEWLRRKPSTNAVVNHIHEYGYSLPHKLEPYGGEFSSLVLQTDELVGWANEGVLRIGICHTMSSKTFWCRVPPIKVDVSNDNSNE